jgi:hypothetical protein
MMHAVRLPPRHLWLTALVALAIALAVVVLGELLVQTDLNLFSGGPTAVDDPTAVPPATWASDPLAPPTILLAH